MIPQDTIAAIATPPGQGAVALLRLSGPQALEIGSRIFRSRIALASSPRSALLGIVSNAEGVKVDQALATFFPGPASYTGEDVLELACHGGVLVTRKVLEALLEAGARLALPGEFTQRAFLHGKLDLTQAEAVMDLISAQTNLALQAAQEQLEGRLGGEIHLARSELLEVLAHVEAYIDFPEEDISPETGQDLQIRMEAVRSRLQRLLATADQGRILREGVRTVIAGLPNAGKSSLLNLLLGFERAIVSEVAGTTRDTIEEVINLRGYPLRLVDTAGLRTTEDAVEKEGVSRTAKQLERAELILEVVDASRPRGERITLVAEAEPRRLLVLNKSDLGLHPDWTSADANEKPVPISCRTGQGRELLGDSIVEFLTKGPAPEGGGFVAINARHQNCLLRATSGLDQALKEFRSGTAPEFVALDLREAMEALGEVVGRMDAEELLGEIFSRFCIGK